MIRRYPRQDTGSMLLVVCLLIFCVTALSVSLADQFIKRGERDPGNGVLLGQVHDAIVGDPDRNSFGYLGDTGEYPATLTDLLANPGGAVVGWKGPYLSGVILDGQMILDPYLSPLEFFLDAAPAAAHKLAIISRGPDHSSTNGAANPNVASQFTGVLPGAGGYASGDGNADNIASVDFVTDAGALDYKNTGSLQLNARIYEEWNNDGILDACPGLYSAEIRSVTRGNSDRLIVPPDRMTLDLLQGVWDVHITSLEMGKEAYSGQVTVRPSALTTMPVYIRRTDASKMPTATVTVTNNLSQTITMTRNDRNFAPAFTVNAGATATSAAQFTCTRIEAKTGGVNGATQYEFLLRYGVASKSIVVSATSHTLTVTNNAGGHRQVVVWIHGPTLAAANPIGSVYERHVRSFSIVAGNTVWVTDAAGTQLDTFVVNAPTMKNY